MSDVCTAADLGHVRGVVVGDSLLRWAELPGFVYIPVATSAQLRCNLQKVRKELGNCLVVCCGSNDLADGSSYQDVVSHLIEFKNEASRLFDEVLICTVPRRRQLKPFVRKTLNKRIRSHFEGRVIDLDRALPEFRLFRNDRIHPLRAGLVRIEKAVSDVVKPLSIADKPEAAKEEAEVPMEADNGVAVGVDDGSFDQVQEISQTGGDGAARVGQMLRGGGRGIIRSRLGHKSRGGVHKRQNHKRRHARGARGARGGRVPPTRGHAGYGDANHKRVLGSRGAGPVHSVAHPGPVHSVARPVAVPVPAPLPRSAKPTIVIENATFYWGTEM